MIENILRSPRWLQKTAAPVPLCLMSQAGQVGTLMFSIVMMRSSIQVRGFSVVAKRSEKDVKALMVERRVDAPSDEPRAEQVERHWNRHVTNEALEAARREGDRGSLQEARQLLEDASQILGASPLVQSGDPVCLGLLSDLRDCMDDLRNRQQYMTMGSKKMAMISRKHGRQRACNVGPDDAVSYTNAMQKETRAAFKMSIA
ncbi:YAF9 [Symbiodinium pilosum]|uniref:YAF9 protein n=1 Tax=Symbiodinium pilosum TaxID=2952 RepID=A0A812ISZ3_SYMPI|nr:YAF9 [Symbiodinium pilosum]